MDALDMDEAVGAARVLGRYIGTEDTSRRVETQDMKNNLSNERAGDEEVERWGDGKFKYWEMSIFVRGRLDDISCS